MPDYYNGQTLYFKNSSEYTYVNSYFYYGNQERKQAAMDNTTLDFGNTQGKILWWTNPSNKTLSLIKKLGAKRTVFRFYYDYYSTTGLKEETNYYTTGYTGTVYNDTVDIKENTSSYTSYYTTVCVTKESFDVTYWYLNYQNIEGNELKDRIGTLAEANKLYNKYKDYSIEENINTTKQKVFAPAYLLTVSLNLIFVLISLLFMRGIITFDLGGMRIQILEAIVYGVFAVLYLIFLFLRPRDLYTTNRFSRVPMIVLIITNVIGIAVSLFAGEIAAADAITFYYFPAIVIVGLDFIAWAVFRTRNCYKEIKQKEESFAEEKELYYAYQNGEAEKAFLNQIKELKKFIIA